MAVEVLATPFGSSVDGLGVAVIVSTRYLVTLSGSL